MVDLITLDAAIAALPQNKGITFSYNAGKRQVVCNYGGSSVTMASTAGAALTAAYTAWAARNGKGAIKPAVAQVKPAAMPVAHIAAQAGASASPVPPVAPAPHTLLP